MEREIICKSTRIFDTVENDYLNEFRKQLQEIPEENLLNIIENLDDLIEDPKSIFGELSLDDSIFLDRIVEEIRIISQIQMEELEDTFMYFLWFRKSLHLDDIDIELFCTNWEGDVEWIKPKNINEFLDEILMNRITKLQMFWLSKSQ